MADIHRIDLEREPMIHRNTFYLIVGWLTLSWSSTALSEAPLGYFTDIRKLGPGVNSASDEEVGPEISSDGLTLYFFSGRSDGFGGLDIWQATRATIDEPFEPALNLGSGVNSSAAELAPVVSPDGLTLYFRSIRSSADDIYQATRAATNEPFGNVVNLAELNSSSVDAPEYADDLNLYFWSSRSGNPDLYAAARASTDEPFANPVDLGPNVNGNAGDVGASLSSDGLVLFFSDFFQAPFRPGGLGNGDIWVATRDSVDEPFDDVKNLNDFGFGSMVNTSFQEILPSLSSDWPAPGSSLYFQTFRPGSESGDIWAANWVPAPELPGDFNNDVVVDGADFLSWQRAESPSPLSATDLADWETHFGTASVSTVPEPTCTALLLGILLLRWKTRPRVEKTSISQA